MAKQTNSSKESAWIKILIQDAFTVSVIACIALCGGLAFNQVRAERLPIIHLPKSERIQSAVTKMGGIAVTSRKVKEWGSPPVVATVANIDLRALREIVNGKTRAILLDARPEAFHLLGHIPGTISLSREHFESDYAKNRAWLESDKSQFIVVYCSDSDCEDSKMVADALVQLGFTRVYVFSGGWSEWIDAHLPEEKAQ